MSNMLISHDSNVHHKCWLSYYIWNRASNCNYAGKTKGAKIFRNIDHAFAASLEVLELHLSRVNKYDFNSYTIEPTELAVFPESCERSIWYIESLFLFKLGCTYYNWHYQYVYIIVTFYIQSDFRIICLCSAFLWLMIWFFLSLGLRHIWLRCLLLILLSFFLLFHSHFIPYNYLRGDEWMECYQINL